MSFSEKIEHRWDMNELSEHHCQLKPDHSFFFTYILFTLLISIFNQRETSNCWLLWGKTQEDSVLWTSLYKRPEYHFQLKCLKQWT